MFSVLIQNPSLRQTKIVNFSQLNNIPDAVKFVVGNIGVVPLTTNDFHEKPRSKPNTLPKQRK